MSIKDEIKCAAVATIECPSCEAKMGEPCHYVGRNLNGEHAFPDNKVPTHQRRLSKFISSEHCRFSTSRPIHVLSGAEDS